MSEEKSPRKILKDRVVDLVKDFINSEGGIDMATINDLFGYPHPAGINIAAALAELPVKFSAPQP